MLQTQEECLRFIVKQKFEKFNEEVFRCTQKLIREVQINRKVDPKFRWPPALHGDFIKSFLMLLNF